MHAQFPAPYCGVTFPSNSNDVGPITLVEFAGFLNTSSAATLANGVNQLENFTSVRGNVAPGQTYSIRVKGNTEGPYNYYVTAFFDWNHNNVFTDAGEAVNVGVINNSTGLDAIQATNTINVPAGALTGSTRMRITFKYNGNATSCNSSGWGQAEDYTLLVGGLPGNNASAVSVSPANLSFCSGNQDISARIANKGGNIISYLTVNWEVDGVAQAPVYWNYPIDTAGSTAGNDTLIVLGNIAFAAGTPKNIKVWTSQPNGTQDTVALDDSVAVSLNAKLNCNTLPAYCTPVFTAYSSCVGGNVVQVNFASINNTVACLSGGGYRDYSNSMPAASVSSGKPYPVSVTIGTPSYRGGAAIWIDYDRNGTFDASEQVQAWTYSGTNPTPYTYTGTINIPGTVSPGYVMMRVMGRENSTPAAPCGSGYGEAHDYLLYVEGKGPNNAAVSGIEPANMSFCAGNTDVKARILNNGSNLINYVTINWELDGVPQGSFTWNTPIDTFGSPAGSDTLVTLGTINFVTGVPHDIKVWTSYPNGVQDTVFYDDSVRVSLRNSSCGLPFPQPYCNISNVPSQVLPVSLVTMGTINNSSSAVATTPPAHEDFTAITANVSRGRTYPITVKANTDGPYYYYVTVFIDWNHNNVLTDAGEIYQIGAVYSSTGIDAVQVTADITVPQTAVSGDTRMRVLLNWNAQGTNPCTISSGYGQAEDYTLVVAPRVNDDAGVKALAGPLNYCPGIHDVYVRVANHGANVITYMNVYWELDGVPQSPATWSVPVDTFGSVPGNDTIVWLGSVQFDAGVQHTIKAWTMYPNSTQDALTDNDTITVLTKPSLGGTYIIGSAPSDYPTLAAAAEDLNMYGVCSPVELYVKTGTYANQQVAINNIPGTSSINTVLITSQAAHPDSVVFSNSSTSSANYLVKLNGAKYVTVKDLSFTALNATYCNVLELASTASFDSIMNCKFRAPVTSGSSASAAVLYANNFSGKNILFSGNQLFNGSYGIYWNGLSTQYPDSCMIVNNTISSTSYAGMYLYYNNNLQCKNNRIRPSSAATYGILCFYTSSSLEISGNDIAGQNAGYGMQLRYITGSATLRPLVANNVIAAGNGSGNTYGLWCRDVSYARFYHNTINVASTGTSTVAGYFYCASSLYSNNQVTNNVFANNGGAYAMYNYLPANAICDYNNLFTTSGSNFVQTSATNYPTFAAWRATGQDKKSVSYRPGFTSNSNLAPNINDSAVWSLNGRALHLTDVPVSVNNLIRPLSHADGAPDIGAFELTPASLPPAAVASPATPAAGTTQVFIFAGDTVARISWDASASVPPAFRIRQASGEKAPFVSTAPFYSNVYLESDMQPGNYFYTLEIPYKEGWRGTLVNESDARIYARNTTSWITNFASTADVSANVWSGQFYQDWQYFTGTDQYNPIPVKLITFYGKKRDEDVVLSWKTASEAGNKGFNIERSFDGRIFEDIGFVKGMDHVSAVTNYQYTDHDVFTKHAVTNVHYRLRQVDYSGKQSYSAIVGISNTSLTKDKISVYPNPYNDVFTVNVSSGVDGHATIELYDINGKRVLYSAKEFHAGDNRFTFNETAALSSGIYFVKVISGNTVSVSRLIKSR